MQFKNVCISMNVGDFFSVLACGQGVYDKNGVNFSAQANLSISKTTGVWQSTHNTRTDSGERICVLPTQGEHDSQKFPPQRRQWWRRVEEERMEKGSWQLLQASVCCHLDLSNRSHSLSTMTCSNTKKAATTQTSTKGIYIYI